MSFVGVCDSPFLLEWLGFYKSCHVLELIMEVSRSSLYRYEICATSGALPSFSTME